MMHHTFYQNPIPSNTNRRRTNPSHVMEVFGTGSIAAPPDEAIITLGVRTSGGNVQAAVQENSSTTTRIIEGLRHLGLSKEQIGSSNFEITPIYEYKDGIPHFVEYRVEHLLEIRLKDATKAGAIYQSAVDNGANIARELRFQLSDPTPYYQQALSMALNNAMEKAKTISSQLSVHMSPIPVKLREVSEQAPIPLYSSAVKFASSEVPIQPKQQVIEARVQAWFQYISV